MIVVRTSDVDIRILHAFILQNVPLHAVVLGDAGSARCLFEDIVVLVDGEHGVFGG